MIWIRSQNKENLVEVNNFSIAEITETDAYGDVLEIVGYTIDCDIQDETYELGEYSTKEKALKVMDLIQDRIVKIKTVKLLENKIPNEIISVIGNKIDEYVFQMPQDDEVQS